MYVTHQIILVFVSTAMTADAVVETEVEKEIVTDGSGRCESNLSIHVGTVHVHLREREGEGGEEGGR